MPAPNDIWNLGERPQTLADIAFAATSINHVEFPDDNGPVEYQENRRQMALNGADELAELEARNQQTTAYQHISCDVGPMSPTYPNAPACGVAAMQERVHGITAYTPNGEALLPRFNTERALSCGSKETSSGVGARANVQTHPAKRIPFNYIPIRTFNSVRGALYDMKHFNELPPTQEGQSPSDVTSFVLTRDGRTPYLLIFVSIILGVISLVLLLRSVTKEKSLR